MAPKLNATQRALIAMYHGYPSPSKVTAVRSAVKYANATRFRALLTALERDGLVHLKDGSVHLTHLGVAAAEELLSQ